MKYPSANDYWKTIIIGFIKEKWITKEDLYSLNKRRNSFIGDYVIEDEEYRQGIGEHEYHIELLRDYLFEKCDFENFMIDATIKWMHENNSENDLIKSGWDNEELAQELVYSEADINSLIDEIIENITDEELNTIMNL